MSNLPSRIILPPPMRFPHVQGRKHVNNGPRLTFRMSEKDHELITEAAKVVNMVPSEFFRWACVSAAASVIEWSKGGAKDGEEAVFTGTTSVILSDRKDSNRADENVEDRPSGVLQRFAFPDDDE